MRRNAPEFFVDQPEPWWLPDKYSAATTQSQSQRPEGECSKREQRECAFAPLRGTLLLLLMTGENPAHLHGSWRLDRQPVVTSAGSLVASLRNNYRVARLKT